MMAKASEPGRVKTRMVPPLTPAEASDFNTAFLKDIAANLQTAARIAPICPWMAYAPAGTARFFETHLPAGIGLLETTAPDLGGCLFRAASELLDLRYRSVCLVNSDSPTLPVSYLVTAATLLATEGDRMVIGPSTDGGYYLIGLKARHRRLFEDITWSTEHVLAQTLARAGEIGLPVVELPSWYDVDDAPTVRTLVDEVIDGRAFRTVGSETTPAHASRTLLRRLLNESDFPSRIGLAGTSARVA